MGVLSEIKYERFAQAIDAGEDRKEACRKAGFAVSSASACRIMKRADVRQRIAELAERRQQIDEMTTTQALREAEVTKVAIVKELALIGFARMDSFISITSGGDAFVDLSRLEDTPDLWAAVKEVVVEEYTEGRGEDARDIKKTKIALHDKRGALIDLAKMHGMVTDKVTNINAAIQIVLSEDELRA